MAFEESREKLGIFSELWAFMRVRKKWWLGPIIMMLLLLGLLVGAIVALAGVVQLVSDVAAAWVVVFGRVGGFVARMLARLDQPFVVVDVDPNKVEAAREENRGELPATRKQLNYLEALVADVVEDGISKFEQMVGKPIGELTREEASEWIGRLSGRAA